MKRILTIFLLTLVACSSQEPAQPNSEAPKNGPDLNASLFLRRGSLVSSDFEQYTIQKGSIFMECGAMQGEKKVVVEDSLVSLQGKNTEKLSYLINQVGNTRAKLEPKGSGRGVFDPGVYQLSITDPQKTREVTTSLDVVRNGTEGLEGALREIAERMRGFSEKKLCDNGVFYGLQKRR